MFVSAFLLKLISGTNQVQVHYLEYDIRTMSYSLKTDLVKFPAAGLQRVYHDCCISHATGELIAGTSVGEIMVFNMENLLYRAALPVATNGVLSVCAAGSFIYVGAGDGKVKKLQGNDQYWSVAGETQLHGRITSLCARSDAEELLAGTDTAKLCSLRTEDMAMRVVQVCPQQDTASQKGEPT
jgi:hypothetical protein